MQSFNKYLENKRSEYGIEFDSSGLARQFVPYFESGQRIEVEAVYGKTADRRRGYVGVTTGWRPTFILLSRSNSISSGDTLNHNDKIMRSLPKWRK